MLFLIEVLKKIPLLNRIDNVLVCEADFVGLRAAVMQKKGDLLTVTHEAHAEAIDFNTAVAELLTQVRKQGWRGKHAVLLTPAVVFTLIELNIPPNHKLSTLQIGEAVRWELEPLLSQHQRLISIGQMLLINGYINATQIDDILSQQEVANQSKNRTVVYKRFGELAVELGYIKQLQLDQCLSRQTWFVAPEGDIQCNWLAQQQAQADDVQSFPWLVAGMNKTLLRHWQAAFSKEGIKLACCYPLTGSAIANLLPKQKVKQTKAAKTVQTNVLFDLHEGLFTGLLLNNGYVQQVLTFQSHIDTVLTKVSEIYHMLAVEAPDEVSLFDAASKSEREAQQLADDLRQIIQQPIQIYAKPAGNISSGMRGAAENFLLKKAAQQLLAVSVDDPSPPLMQRFEVKAVLAVVALSVLIGAAEGSIYVRKYLLEQDIVKVDVDLQKVNEAINRIQTQVNEVKKYKDQINEQNVELEELNGALALMATDLPKRNETIIKLLNALDITVSEDVVIDRFVEDTILGFGINAWSIDEQSAQVFVKDFQLAVHPLGYKLRDITVNQQTGRLGLLGYAINFNFTTLDDQSWANAKGGIK